MVEKYFSSSHIYSIWPLTTGNDPI